MTRLSEFSLRHPETIEEAAGLLAAEPEVRVIAGGTALLTNLRLGLGRPTSLVSLERIAGLDKIEVSAQAARFGAGRPLAGLASDPAVRTSLPALAEAVLTVAGPSHRSAATLGGNLCLDTRCVYYNQNEVWRRSNGYCLKYGGEICHVAPQGKRCHAAYSGDLAPLLLVLQAEITVTGIGGVRRMPLGQLYHDDGAQHLTLARGELITEVSVPLPAPGMQVAYRKARVRDAIDFPLAGVAMGLRMDAGRVAELHVALTGTNSQPVLLSGTAELRGAAADEALAERVGKLVQRQASPQRTTVTTSNYRRQVAAALARRLVLELAAAGSGQSRGQP